MSEFDDYLKRKDEEEARKRADKLTNQRTQSNVAAEAAYKAALAIPVIGITPLASKSAVKSSVESDADKAVRIRALGKSGNIKTSNRGDTSSALIGIRKLTGS